MVDKQNEMVDKIGQAEEKEEGVSNL